MQKKRGVGAQGGGSDHPYRRDENILCAILALLKELDKNGLEFVIKDCNKRISKMDNNFWVWVMKKVNDDDIAMSLKAFNCFIVYCLWIPFV